MRYRKKSKLKKCASSCASFCSPFFLMSGYWKMLILCFDFSVFAAQTFLINFNHFFNFVSFTGTNFAKLLSRWKIFQVAHFAQETEFRFCWIFSRRIEKRFFNVARNQESEIVFDYGQDNVCSKEACRCLHSGWSQKFSWRKERFQLMNLIRRIHRLTVFWNHNNSIAGA